MRQAATPVSRAILASYVAFIGAGLMTSSWAARIPQVKSALDLPAGQWGFVLLAMAAGSVTALPLAGLTVDRFGAKRSVQMFSVLGGLSLMSLGVAHYVGVAAVVVGLYLMGFGLGTWDVSMNVEAGAVERAAGRSVMSKFHAGYSIGTVAGALLGVVTLALHISTTTHLVTVGAFLAVGVPLSVRNYLAPPTVVDQLSGASEESGKGLSEHVDTFADPADIDVPGLSGVTSPRGGSGDAAKSNLAGTTKMTLAQVWRDPRTLGVGIFLMVVSFSEGAAVDWIGLGMIEDRGTAPAYGTLGLAVFLTFMTASRWFGTALLDKFGRVPVLRTTIFLFAMGILVFVFAPTAELAFGGAALWGIGASLGFPVGMSAAGDDPVNSAMRVSVVASIGYVAFLAGPPLLGVLAQNSTILYALLAPAVLSPIAFFLAPLLREPSARSGAAQ